MIITHKMGASASGCFAVPARESAACQKQPFAGTPNLDAHPNVKEQLQSKSHR